MYVSQIVDNYKGKIKDDNIFFAPDIPQRKLANALKAYASGVNESEVLLLVDDTVFGSAKNGMMVTHTEILYKNLLDDTGCVKFNEIENIGEKHGLVLSDIAINGVEIQLSQPSKKNNKLLGEFLKEICRSEPSSKPNNLAQIIVNYKDKIKDDKIFFAPNIPQKKLANAIKSYANGVNESEVVLLVEETGGGEYGMMITDTDIFYKNPLDETASVKISAIETIDEKHGFLLSAIFINGTEFGLTAPLKKNMKLLGALFREICSFVLDRKQNTEVDLDWSEVEQQISAPVPKNCKACGAPNQLNSCEYCETPV